MYLHFVKMAFRNQLKNKLFSIVNIFGLAIGIAVSVLIINYVSFEFSFDRMHSKRDRIYRVESQFYEGSQLTDDWGTSSFGYGSAISNELTGIEDYARVGVQNTEQTVIYHEKRIRESGIAYTGPGFLSVFDFKLKAGSPDDQFRRPNTVVLTESAARNFFPDEDPIGKLLTFASGSNFQECEVTGVMADFPANSHIHFNYLISYETLPDWMKEFWFLHEAYTYLLLEPGKNPADIEAAFPELAEKYNGDVVLSNKTWAVKLTPLTGIHLTPQKQYERETKGNRRSLYTLIVIAIVILLTAWINYINLATARSMERARDVGVRKVSGAMQIQLIRQYLAESWLVNLTAMLLAALLVLLFKPLFDELTGENIGFFLFREPLFWMSTFGVLLLGVFLSGFYPAFVMTRVKPAVILKGNYFNSGSAGTMRRTLVVFQFAAALFLICGTFIVYKQVQFMQQQNLGVNINQTIVLKFPVSRENLGETVARFAENLKEAPAVSAVTVTGAVPGMEVAYYASNRLQGAAADQYRLYEMLSVDYDFFDTFKLELAAGRPFQRGFGNDFTSVVVNEAALTSLGIGSADDAIGKNVLLESVNEPARIIGVTKNWHQRGLNNDFTPIIFVMNGRISWVPAKYIAVKAEAGNYESALQVLEQQWKSYFPQASFDYFFLDQYFDSQYKSDRRFGRIVSVFTGLAFFISMLGLWALAAFTASKKIKEVGVRKVLGANKHHIFFLFSREILILILIALTIATPLSIWVMSNWLSNFAFRTGISFWIYTVGGLMTIAIALVTISWQSWRAAVRNPVEALRYE
ncbi:ABC transporter permease [Mangrovibacterium lignilyticum]|uniref:ABC transporter permease n=1 Tax=Mangrovibacterium lignilyticum TaxID=2668052 RepID=UPI0013D3A18C|nr:ABC transporter permease [Mangrovibacterium lignilyticum]